LGIKEIYSDAFGFSAQDVQKVFPEAVNTNDKGFLDFDIHPILIAQINAIKELNAKIEEQQKKIEQLEVRNSEIDALEAELEAIKAILGK
jgi:trimeric autotransporter adhesin